MIIIAREEEVDTMPLATLEAADLVVAKLDDCVRGAFVVKMSNIEGIAIDTLILQHELNKVIAKHVERSMPHARAS